MHKFLPVVPVLLILLVGCSTNQLQTEAAKTTLSETQLTWGPGNPAYDASTNSKPVTATIPVPAIKGINVTLQAVEDAFPDIYFKESNEMNAHGKVTTGWRSQQMRIQTIGPDDNLYSISIGIAFSSLEHMGGYEELNQMLTAVDKSILLADNFFAYRMEEQASGNASIQSQRGTSIKYTNGKKVTVVWGYKMQDSGYEMNGFGVEMFIEPDDRTSTQGDSGWHPFGLNLEGMTKDQVKVTLNAANEVLTSAQALFKANPQETEAQVFHTLRAMPKFSAIPDQELQEIIKEAVSSSSANQAATKSQPTGKDAASQIDDGCGDGSCD